MQQMSLLSIFSRLGSIEDYLRFVKKEVMKLAIHFTPLRDEFFNEDIHPEEMEFDIKFVGNSVSTIYSSGSLQYSLTATYLLIIIESNIPGRELRWMVYEKNTKNGLGFIRFGSPTINSKPRNEWLGKAADLSIFNRHAAMGFCHCSISSIWIQLSWR